MNEAMTLGKFLKQYNSNDACLEKLKNILYPDGITCAKCKKIRNFTKKKGKPVYQCFCGYQISPLARTIFHKSPTPLQYWFYAIFIMKTTRSGISAKALQRELGVTYKCAFRMFHQIRKLMTQSEGTMLDGVVEVDETYFTQR